MVGGTEGVIARTQVANEAVVAIVVVIGKVGIVMKAIIVIIGTAVGKSDVATTKDLPYDGPASATGVTSGCRGSCGAKSRRGRRVVRLERLEGIGGLSLSVGDAGAVCIGNARDVPFVARHRVARCMVVATTATGGGVIVTTQTTMVEQAHVHCLAPLFFGFYVLVQVWPRR